MGSESVSASHEDRDLDDDEEYEEAGGGSRLLGFMFGNVDNSGELEVDYLDKDAKEHIDGLAGTLGPSLVDIDLSGKSPETPAATLGVEDYDEKAEDAVDYEDIEEQYEGPETENVTEEDHLMPKNDFVSVGVSATALVSSVFDDENYDDDDDEGGDDYKNNEGVVHESEAGTLPQIGFNSNTGDGDIPELVHNDSANQESAVPVVQPEDGVTVFDKKLSSGVDQTNFSAGFAGSIEEESSLSESAEDRRSITPLPVLCVENGMPVLRFSEIFGVSEPLKKAAGRGHKYSVSKDKYTSLDTSVMLEADEEAFLKGSCQVFSTKKPLVDASAEQKTILDDDSEFVKFDPFSGKSAFRDERKDSCLSAEPMRKDSAFDFSVEWQSCMSKEFYSLDQQDWEDNIVWGNSPAVTENSAEICELELSGIDSEVDACEEREITSKPGYRSSDVKSEIDGKDTGTLIALCASAVEPFDSGDLSTFANTCYSKTLHHPQLLRLESRLVMSSSNLSPRKELATEESQNLDFMKRFKHLTLQSKDLVEGSWIENIIWDSEKPIAKSKLILDLQDEHMLFEILDNKEYEHLRVHAGAVVTARTGKIGDGAFGLPGHVASSGGQFNIANDIYYSDRRTSPQVKSLSKKRTAHGVKILHSIPAWTLQTMKPKLSNKEVANFHRPKAKWYPYGNEVAAKELAKLPAKGPMKVILKSLGSSGSKIYVDAEETITSFKAKASKKLDFSLTEAVKIYYFGKELEDEKTFAEQNILPNSLLYLVRTKIHVLPMAHMLSNEKKSLRPPGAFKKKSDLSARDGHVFLMEYCEERPLLLGNPGMGARLYTYYQKSSSDDQNGDLLRSGNSGLGTVVTLEPADKSPFLGEVKPGGSQSSLETEMYKAPVFRHRVASTDYLLVRSSKGKLSIRRIDNIHVVGQQEPLIEVMPPGSKNLQNYLWNRLLVYMYREFRAAQKRSMPPCIHAAELSAMFPNVAEHFLRKRLKHCADLQKGPNGRLQWVMRRNFHIPSEEELRKMMKPETVCSYESMQAGLYRLKRLGISRLANLTTPAQLAALSSAMNQLPGDPIALAAASHIEREMQITPWNLSANFVACIGQEKGNVERLEISGVGDPSGRGLGFSYVRMASKPPVTNALAKKKPVVARGSTVTGTDADLRRLSMEAARELLLKFNVPEEQIGKLTRWHRIALIRQLSSEQAASGVKVDPTTISKFARGQRMSFLQLQQQSREKCQDIWDRQMQSLSTAEGFENESDSEANSDLDSFAGDLENLLDAEEGEEGDEGTLEMKICKSDGVKGLKVRRHPPHIRQEEEVEDEAAEAAELCRMLIEGDGAKWKKKKKTRPGGEAAGLIQGGQRPFVVENATPLKRPSAMVRQTDGTAVPNDVLGTKTNDNLKESKKAIFKKAKVGKKNEVVPLDLSNKKIKIVSDNPVGINNRKSARESFVCGACGQLGHMRTNKHCPKYREDPDAQMSNTDVEIEAVTPTIQDPSPSQSRIPVKKPIPRSTANSPQVEDPEGEKSTVKTKVLKVIYPSSDKAIEKVPFVPSMSSEQPRTPHPEISNKAVPKVIKIVSNKTKPDDVQIESQKLSVVIRPPSDTSRDHLHKKITIKQPKKDQVINLDQMSEEGADFDYRKTKKIIDLTSVSSSRQEETMGLGEVASRNTKMARRMWEEEEKKRNIERIKEEQARRLFEEEMRMRDEAEKLADLRRYEEDIRIEREEEELRKANKKFKKKRPSEVRDDYFEGFQGKRSNRTLPGRDRSAKRKINVEVGRYEVGYNPASKRRRGGEVGLANILEEIVEILKERREVSYLFQKPVSKKEAPDYLDVVEYPMDLATIKEKVRRLEYKNRDEFRHDVWQIAFNAHLYNDGRNPGIPPLADQLLEICDYLIHEKGDLLEEAEASISDA
ncbi:transcription initiation factor TFIID subunit 1 isoform X2 [Silene latifolia]|uniref:transcription initiation factor TFIID subunit 1 isoform X2 n=1 Tax=Silene latifolia TaxID=37657 RepID=UPI003D775BA4